MKTYQYIKQTIDFDFIKWCCELAIGFEVSNNNIITTHVANISCERLLENEYLLLSLLIHRSVSGANTVDEKVIIEDKWIKACSVFKGPYRKIATFYYRNYMSDKNITVEELARLEALLYLWEKISASY